MDVYVYGAVRTPRGKAGRGGSLRHITPVALLTTVLKAMRERNNLGTSYQTIFSSVTSSLSTSRRRISRVPRF
jgi:acetyl-CoA acetyltransferase